MLHHNIQQKVINALARSKGAHFSDLKPKNVESNAFNYHLKTLVSEGFVEKDTDGLYKLTSLGKKIGVNADMSFADWISQAHSILLMAVKNDKGEYLLRRRKIHPMYDYLGFLHGEPKDDQTVTETAKQLFQRSTGLVANFTVRGSGFSRFISNGQTESFNSLTVLFADTYTGELAASGETGDNIWMSVEDALGDEKLFPNMPPIFEKLARGDFFWFDILEEV